MEKKQQQLQLTQMLQVGDLMIASPNQVPYLEASDPFQVVQEVINFLRSGCPLVQVAFSRGAPDGVGGRIGALRSLLDSVSLEGEAFEVSEPKDIEETVTF